MTAAKKEQFLQDIKKVFKKYSIESYNSDAVVEILSSSLKRHKKHAEELLTDQKVAPSKILKTQREKMGFSLSELAKKTGLAKSNLSAMENDKRPIGLKVAKMLSQVLGISYKALL